MNILVTGSAGFIGSALTLRLLEQGDKVIGIDNHNSYYDPNLKEMRLVRYIDNPSYSHYRVDLSNYNGVHEIFKKHRPQVVVNLAAQAGVRYSIENPLEYINSNILGFAHILENCRNSKVEHLVYASTSSVYGGNTQMPFSENQSANHPLSLYAASKKSNELMAHTYSYLYQLPTTGLRFFTVYGPWGRPDMALFKFTKNILDQKPIEVFNNGKHTRDFTYIDDIVEGVMRTIKNYSTSNLNWNSNQPDPATSNAPWRIFNIGNGQPIQLLDYIYALEKALGRKANMKLLPMQLGDVENTFCDISNLKNKFNYKPETSILTGINKFVDWYKKYYKI